MKFQALSVLTGEHFKNMQWEEEDELESNLITLLLLDRPCINRTGKLYLIREVDLGK